MFKILLRPSATLAGGGLTLPKPVFNGLRLQAGQMYEIQAGPRRARAVVTVGDRAGIGAELRHKLRLPALHLRLHITRSEEQLRLGPFMGILAKPQHSSEFGEQTSFFARMISQADKLHICAFVFSPAGFDAATGSVRALVSDASGRWQQARYPVPDVIYDRGFFKRNERVSADRLRAGLSACGAQLFNADLGDKWQMHRYMMADPLLQPYLPETALVSAGVTGELLNRHKMVYIKPTCGNQGRHVFRVQQQGQKLSVMAHIRKGEVRNMQLPNLSALYRHLDSTAEPCPYMVQQGLNLRKVHGRTVDLRALVQKGRAGVWQLTGVGVRMGAQASVVSNLHAGGQAARLDVLKEAGGEVDAGLYARIEALVLQVSTTLEQHSLLGELGVDLGLDNDARLWVIEVNMKPGRATFHRARLLTAWRRSGMAPLEYAMYLWEQAVKSSGGEGGA